MTNAIEILIYLQFALINIWWARIHANQWVRSQTGKPFFKIRHGWWGAAYCGLVFSMWLIFRFDLYLTASIVILRKPLFDCLYNHFRGFNLFFVNPSVDQSEASTTSIIDDIHYWVFKKRADIYQPIYLAISIFLLIKSK